MEFFVGVFLWLLLVVSLTIIGSQRTIGGTIAFVLSFFLTPLVGAMFVFSSRHKGQVEYEQAHLQSQKHILTLLQASQQQSSTRNLSPINHDEL